MPIEFACESCTKLLRVPDGTGGQSCQCPACGKILEIPDPGAIEIVEVVGETSTDRRLNIPCPKCKFSLRVDPGLLGTKGQCRNCKYIFLITTDPAAAGNATEAQATGLVFTCPKCSQLFEGRDDMQGRKGKCHTCGEVFTIALKRVEEPEMKTVRRSPPLKSPQPNRSAQARPQAVSLPIRLACPTCEGVMEVPATAAGQTTACPYCQQLLEIPGTAAEISPSPAPQPSAASSTTQSKPRTISSSHSDRRRPSKSSPPIRQRPAKQKQHADRLPSFEPSTPQQDVWDELGDLSGAANTNPYAVVSDFASTPGETAWAAPQKAVRRGLTFANAFSLAFEVAFPACLSAMLIYMLIGIASAVLGYGSLFLLGLFIGTAGIEPDIAIWIVGPALVIIGLVCISLGTAGLCMVCNGALATVRQRRAASDELFSTGGVFFPMLIFLFVAGVVGAVLGAIPQAVGAIVGPQNAIFVVLSALCILPFSLAFSLGTCLAPIAIVDGHGPIDAMLTSVRILLANPLAMMAVIVCAGFGYLMITLVTCGLAGVILMGFPYYLMAACYHLATR